MKFENGVKGYPVKLLQETLAYLGYYHNDVTEEYDAATSDAVKQFQTDNKLADSGVADEDTQMMLVVKAAIAEKEAEGCTEEDLLPCAEDED